MLLGAVADDLTGATDLALTLSRGGLRTVQFTGVPDGKTDLGNVDAVVIALKSRTIPAAEAVQQSLAAAKALQAMGARQLFFKYCSTFDSTPDGNIGPVADALLDLLGAPLTLACPAFPTNKRTIYQAHLFVGDQLLSESPMKDHPLTPMRDANLVRVLQAQTKRKVGLVAHAIVAQGAAAIRTAFNNAQADGTTYLIVDAITDNDLLAIGTAAANLPLVTGGSGAALGLPANFRCQGLLPESTESSTFPTPTGRRVILAGSCSAMTRQQIATAQAAGIPNYRIDPLKIADGTVTAEKIAAWVLAQDDAAKPPLVFSSADPAEVAAVQAKLGRDAGGALIEHLLGDVAQRLAATGYTKFLVAGGETSGAVVAALGVKALRIGPEIDPGVPWTLSLDAKPLALGLKSGNFGAPDFFLKAWDKL